MKHTKGKWEAQTYPAIYDGNEVTVVDVATTEIQILELNVQHLGIQQAEANAKLIAAAPELLEEFEYILHCFYKGDLKDADEHYIKSAIISICNRAIKKATS